jgi:hypothetical protein
MPATFAITLQKADLILHGQPGGGGHGDPFARDPERVGTLLLEREFRDAPTRRDSTAARARLSPLMLPSSFARCGRPTRRRLRRADFGRTAGGCRRPRHGSYSAGRAIRAEALGWPQVGSASARER